MENAEPDRRHRRRGRGTRRKHQTTNGKSQPCRIPAGLRSEEPIFNPSIPDLESDSDFSEDRTLTVTSAQPPSPTLKPLLTSRADTPMLGAQARAAELAAASAAKQRQVSRELEERQLPPNPAVSLSAFTKPQTTRNKGNKTWKPLILDDIVESDDPATSDPAISTPNVDRLTAKEASDKRIPTAPRAMVAGRSLSTGIAQPQPSPVVNMPRQGYGPRLGGFPYPVLPQVKYSHPPPFLGGMPLKDAATYGSMMVPDDISPTKQEQKFSMLENIPFPHLHGQQPPQFGMIQGMMQHDDPFHGTPQTFGDEYMWDNPNTYLPGYQVPFQGQHQMSGGYGNESDGTYNVQRTIPTRGESESLQPTCRSSGQPHESPLRYQEPYDTERAMKECKSQLKEKAKDGKTVLHNPKAQPERRASNDPHAPVPWEVRPKDSIRDPKEWEVMPPPADQTSGACDDLADIKPAPGLPFPSTFGPPQLSFGISQIETDAAPAVGSLEWMRLAPLTSAERDRVRRGMALAAKSLTNEVPLDTITTGQGKEDLSESQNWFYTDPRGERLLRQQVHLSAQDHASKVMDHIRAHNGGGLPPQFQNGKDDGVAATLILGNVACNLQTYLVGDRKSLDQRKNFHKVKSVPDWCTERGGLTLGGLGGGDSYFDGVAGGFYGAPVRVARDPRFRPQVKEGMKVKPEEEWKNRHEMYGRRIM